MRYRQTVFALLSAVLILMLLSSALENPTQVSPVKKNKKKEKSYNHAARLHQEFLMLRDPATNRIPENMRVRELEYAKTLPKSTAIGFYHGKPEFNGQALQWIERGPNNTAGRIRALGIDIRTTGTPTLIAGAVSGGIWKSIDGGTTWIKKTVLSELHSVTCIAQDTRPGHQDTWYYGTGEFIGNSAATTGAPYLGDGVYKSTDNGETWSPLPATQVGGSTQFTSDWQYVYSVAVHPQTGTVYAATTGGIYRSDNGGTSWTNVLDAATQNPIKTDVTIAADGTVYTAASSDAGSIKGIRKSVNDGGSFSDVTPGLPDNYGRTVITTAPSNSGVVYFLTEGISGGTTEPDVHGHQLWRTANAGTGWQNISFVIPENTAPALDNFSTQSGYDMMLAVKPDNPNFLIVGGVSLFKIHDVTNDVQSLAEKHIGGYGIAANGTINAVGDFMNHHPDQHTGVFKPGNPNEFYCGNDGGVHHTLNITATPGAAFWQTPMRSTLNITQLYSVTIDKSAAGSPFIAGGFQDRGNWMARTDGALQNWQEISGGDGAYAEIDPTGTYVFQSVTEGELFRYLKSNTTSPIPDNQLKGMKPAGLANPLFLTPFDVDDNSGDIIYLSGGNSSVSTTSGVWRTTNGTSETPAWTYFTNSEVTDEQVTAIQASKSNATNVLYYGTSGGKLFKIENANTADAGTVQPTDITGTGFPQGYINSIAIHPENASIVTVAFTNYNVNRIWHSTDGGTSWTSVSGNLNNQNAPSVRWVETFVVNSVVHYVLATSTGVYFTTELNGNNTVWTQEAVHSIGNVVVMMLDFRPSDNTLVAATHGRGVWQASVPEPMTVKGDIPNDYTLEQNYPNPFNPSTSIPFAVANETDVTITAYDVTGKLIRTIASGRFAPGKHQVLFSADGLPSGVYLYRIKAGAFTQTRKMVLLR